MPFSPQVKAQALIACGRSCCICNEFCGTRIECHHIIPEVDGGSDDFENCIPLCFDCHAEVGHYNAEHPKGNKFTPDELRGHRNAWYLKRKGPDAPNADQTVITKEDVVKAFSAIQDFSEDDVRARLDYLHQTLLKNGVVTPNQLFQLVSSAPVLNTLRRIYIALLKRDIKKTFDPAAVAVWGAALYSYGSRPEIISEIEWRLRQSPEYREKNPSTSFH
jgi:hypothetical protein